MKLNVKFTERRYHAFDKISYFRLYVTFNLLVFLTSKFASHWIARDSSRSNTLFLFRFPIRFFFFFFQSFHDRLMYGINRRKMIKIKIRDFRQRTTLSARTAIHERKPIVTTEERRWRGATCDRPVRHRHRRWTAYRARYGPKASQQRGNGLRRLERRRV